MAISRTRKDQLLAEYRQQMADSSGILMANYTALSVAKMECLRQLVREQEGQIFVVKNTLIQKVLEELGLKVPEELLAGATIAAFCHGDVAPVAKAIRAYIKEVEAGKFVIKGGVMEGRILSAAQANAAADLPTREEALSMVLRTINAPATQSVGVIASGIRQILNVVNAYVTKLEEEGGAPAEAAA